MANKTYKLGELIELSNETNSDEKYGIDDVRGINNLKQMMKSKADLNGRDLSKFSIVRPGYFVFNHRTSRNGSKFSITYNYDSVPHIFTEDYVVFHIKEESKSVLSIIWLYLYFNRPEFDRYVITNSWGSSTEFYNWDDLCDIDITLPDLKTQEKYVEIYEALVENQKSYESGLDDLKLVCDAYIEELRRKMPCEKIGKYIRECNERNVNLTILDVKGVESSGNFVETKANTVGLDFSNYKIVEANHFSYNPSRINLGSIALKIDSKCIVSPMYTVFKVNNPNELIPEYLMLWLSRSEFRRSTQFFTSGSVRDTFDFAEMCEVEIPIPTLEIQQSIADIYKVYNERKAINETLKSQIKDICPILIKGSLEEAKED